MNFNVFRKILATLIFNLTLFFLSSHAWAYCIFKTLSKPPPDICYSLDDVNCKKEALCEWVSVTYSESGPENLDDLHIKSATPYIRNAILSDQKKEENPKVQSPKAPSETHNQPGDEPSQFIPGSGFSMKTDPKKQIHRITLDGRDAINLPKDPIAFWDPGKDSSISVLGNKLLIESSVEPSKWQTVELRQGDILFALDSVPFTLKARKKYSREVLLTTLGQRAALNPRSFNFVHVAIVSEGGIRNPSELRIVHTHDAGIVPDSLKDFLAVETQGARLGDASAVQNKENRKLFKRYVVVVRPEMNSKMREHILNTLGGYHRKNDTRSPIEQAEQEKYNDVQVLRLFRSSMQTAINLLVPPYTDFSPLAKYFENDLTNVCSLFGRPLSHRSQLEAYLKPPDESNCSTFVSWVLARGAMEMAETLNLTHYADKNKIAMKIDYPESLGLKDIFGKFGLPIPRNSIAPAYFYTELLAARDTGLINYRVVGFR